MRKADVITALIILIIGILVVYDGVRLGVIGWGAAGPMSGLYPFLLGMGLVIGSLVVMGRVFIISRKSMSNEPFIRKGGLRNVLYVAIPAALMVALTEFIGLYIAAGLYLALYMRWIGKHRWITVLAVSILLPLISSFVFDKYFLIPLPNGRLRGLLGF
ncbi:MAG: tripartite tricarboxylate transporter TctB family protein [Nitrospirae bacterium]|nr:tripartite tricarboxylate transporter TctB family protein [Nitrospirota bacterium]